MNTPRQHGKRRYSRGWTWLAALLLLASGASASAQESKPAFELAITPFLPVRTMMQNYEPMRAFLEVRLQEPVSLITAPDYKVFNERMRRYDYAFVVTVANSAYLAQSEYGYIPMLRPAILTRPVLVTTKQSPLKNLKALHGATLTMPDRLAVVSMQGVHMLRAAGLNPEQDVKIKYMPNHAAAVNWVISGEAQAAIVSDRALLQMPEATRNAVRIVQTWEAGAMPGIVYLASPHVSVERVARMRQAILEYVRDTEAGRTLIKNLGYGDLVPSTPEELAPLAPYGALLKTAQEAAP